MSEIIVVLFAQLAGWGVIVIPVMFLLINVLGNGIPYLKYIWYDTIGKNHWIIVEILTIIPTITVEIGKYKDNK